MYQVNEHNQDFFFCTKTVRHAFAPEVFLTLNIPTGGYLARLRMQLVHILGGNLGEVGALVATPKVIQRDMCYSH